ncbi:Endo-1,4-beta-xylanase, GH35 family [Fibrobacter sp. UWR3]|uniref:endo-1,4-beta-xylanase n=1 Tax=Fibrobacter sp. UWR3 TaxID=1896217 RepID=UPI000919E4BA|nr:endo-1,4-beta-xylanase [Fibrobacter sp. UWR3]SHM75850.1 Endo-1,4-beta-xylanase, GH35 family [Fibrobacter sp. UWR3]
MNFLNAKSTLALTAALLAAPALAQNVLTNGDMSYGDGGWYLWNNPDGPAKVDLQLGQMGLGVDGSEGVKVTVKELPNPSWGLQLQPPKWLADSAYYTLTFKAKGNMPINAIVQGGAPDWRQKESASFMLTNEWKTYSMTFLADQKGYGLNNVTFHVGLAKGWMQMDDVEIEKVEGLDDMTWYNNSAARIDSLRKKELTVKAAPGAQVKVELMRHAFPFGTALALYPSKDSVETWYRKTANKYFWYGVPENQFKWPEYEPKKGKIRRDEFKQYLDYVNDYKWGFRAHTLVWGHQGYGFDKHFSNQGSCKDISNKIKDRITRDVKEYKGRIKEYDVWNEAFHEPFIFNKCGWDLLDSAHVWAHRADPDARLFINEYNVVAAGETERLYDIVKGMLDRKVPVHGIGVQCHFGDRQLNPNFIKKRLDRLGSLGLPIKITELDFGDWQKGMYFGEDEQARRYEMVLRIAFSHPAVEGIVLWGFWDGRHWVKNGGIVAMDGREKPAAKLIYDLWHKVWTTNGTFKADENGVVKFRGYPGKYKVTVDGKSEMVDLR